MYLFALQCLRFCFVLSGVVCGVASGVVVLSSGGVVVCWGVVVVCLRRRCLGRRRRPGRRLVVFSVLRRGLLRLWCACSCWARLCPLVLLGCVCPGVVLFCRLLFVGAVWWMSTSLYMLRCRHVLS